MPGVIFEHPFVKHGTPLVIDSGMDQVNWSYRLNIARFPTYGGEVVQVLSAYVDDLSCMGTVRTYAAAEAIYEYFMEYFTRATQGASTDPSSSERFTQVPMIMHYPHRQWTLEIQPLQAPGFTYDQELITPVWMMKAHIVDRGLDKESLEALVVKETVHELQHKDEFKLQGVISLEAGNPALNPFISPRTGNAKINPNTGAPEFSESEFNATKEGLGRIADYYSHLLPAYLKGEYEDIIGVAASKPAFGEEQKDPKTEGKTNKSFEQGALAGSPATNG